MKIRGIFLFFLVFFIFVYVQLFWVKVGISDKGIIWEMKIGLFLFEKMKGGNVIVFVIGCVVDKSGIVFLYKWYVFVIDCGR